MQVRSNNEKEIVKANQRGIVLPIIMIIMLSLSVLGLSSLAVWDFNSRSTVLEKNQLKAYYIARSGSEATASYILSNPDALTMKNYVDQLVGHESSVVTLGDGTFRVHLTRDSVNHLINIISVGLVGNVSKTSTITLNETTSSVSLTPTLKAGEGAFSQGSITIAGSSKIVGDVGTNSTAAGGVTLTGTSSITGTVSYPGTSNSVVSAPSGYMPTLSENAAIRSYTLPSSPTFPTITTPGVPFTAGWWPSPPYSISADGQYTDLTVLSTLVIDVGSGQRNIRVNNLRVTGDGKITLTGSGTLNLYVDNTFTLSNSGNINLNGDPTKLIMYYKGSGAITLDGNTRFFGTIYTATSDVNLTGSGNLTGNLICGGSLVQNPAQTVNISGDSSEEVQAIYAPNAVVNLTNSGRVKGVVIAKSINMSGNTRVTYSASATDTFPSFLWQNSASGVTAYSMNLRG